MCDLVVQVDRLSKQYQLGMRSGRHTTFREMISESLRGFGACRPSGRTIPNDAEPHTMWALRDVCFEVRQGEVVGIVGRNGAGKSTLLKILSRITEPTLGFAELRGRVGSLLEVGTGFHPELTGRENVYLSGAILGMRKSEIDRQFDAIVAFAEVERFVDTPVKRYSSGMYLRLAFAVAAHLEPEILLVDEVLAVGDASFQKRCLGKMGEVARQGRTIFLVSHNLAAVTHLCTRALWLDEGTLRMDGDSEDIVAQYLASSLVQRGEVRFSDSQAGSEYIRLRAVRVLNDRGQVTALIDMRHPFTVEVEYTILRRTSGLRIGIGLIAQDSSKVLSSTDADSTDAIERTPGSYVSQCTFPGEFFNAGVFAISVGADFPMVRRHFFLDRVLAFHVEHTGGVGGMVPDRREGAIRVRLPWQIRTAA